MQYAQPNFSGCVNTATCKIQLSILHDINFSCYTFHLIHSSVGHLSLRAKFLFCQDARLRALAKKGVYFKKTMDEFKNDDATLKYHVFSCEDF